ncbi:hypothetical protein SESBI_02356 [Sesbania bispinosa]|nr:hypothetical protein SESBI_02356 [Sesbania bispinosa]
MSSSKVPHVVAPILLQPQHTSDWTGPQLSTSATTGDTIKVAVLEAIKVGYRHLILLQSMGQRSTWRGHN